MKYEYTVKYNGVWYEPGAEVPDGNGQEVKETGNVPQKAEKKQPQTRRSK